MALASPRQLFGGILGTPERRAWQRGRWVRPEVDVGVAQQRQDRVIERRRRQLDLPSLGGVAVFGDHAAKNLELDIPEDALVRFVEVLLLFNQRAHPRVRIQVERIDPRQLVPHLQIEEIAVGESAVRVPFVQ